MFKISTSNYEKIDCDSLDKEVDIVDHQIFKNVWDNLKDEDILSIEIGDNRLQDKHLCESPVELCFHSVLIKLKNGETYYRYHPLFQIYRNKVVFNRLTDEQKEHVSRKRNVYGEYGSLYTPEE